MNADKKGWTQMHSRWWANVTDLKTTHVQRNAWREAGYDAFLISGSERVTFRKAGRFR
jgi:hypothetical protein